MEKGPASVGVSTCSYRSSLLPPKIPISSAGPSYREYVSHESNPHHRRTSSESVVIEKPCWFDELLDEPETPVRKGGHRRSPSDSFAYSNVSNAVSNVGIVQSSGSAQSSASEGKEAAIHGSKGYEEKNDYSHGKPSPSEADTKCARRQFPPRPRVERQQYIAKLQGDVEALEAVTSGASAQLEFVKRQNLIIDMENMALKGRLGSLAQEKLIKSLEHEALQREVSRLRALYQQQQQQQHSQRSSYRRRF